MVQSRPRQSHGRVAVGRASEPRLSDISWCEPASRRWAAIETSIHRRSARQAKTDSIDPWLASVRITARDVVIAAPQRAIVAAHAGEDNQPQAQGRAVAV